MRLSLATPVPKITGINPGSMLVESNISGTRTFDVYGANFTFGLTTTWNGEPVENQFVNSRQLRLNNVDYSSIRTGENRLRVTIPVWRAGPPKPW